MDMHTMEMVLLVHGFPNEISALKFEWAWKHPHKSRRLRHVEKKNASEKSFEFRFRILSEMLRVGPWNRLPLVIRWLCERYFIDFKIECLPPCHMPVVHGPMLSRSLLSSTLLDFSEIENDIIQSLSLTLPPSASETLSSEIICYFCQTPIKNPRELMTCFVPHCTLKAHVICLAEKFASSEVQIIPLEGACPVCSRILMWGDLVKFKKNNQLQETDMLKTLDEPSQDEQSLDEQLPGAAAK